MSKSPISRSWSLRRCAASPKTQDKIKHLLVVQDVPAKVSWYVSLVCTEPSMARRPVTAPLSFCFINICDRRYTASGSMSEYEMARMALYLSKILDISLVMPADVLLMPRV